MKPRLLFLLVGSFLLPPGCGGDKNPTDPPLAKLVVTTTSLPDAAPTVAYSETLVATGGDSSYTWSVTVGSLPTGLTLTASTGIISGTPSGSGSSFTVEVTSGDGQTATRPLTITLLPVLAVTTTSLPDGVENVDYGTDTLTATGGDGTYSWSFTLGSLPTGLSLNASTGVISGTPTVAGPQSFTVQVSSGDGQTAQQALSITVLAVPVGLTFQSVSAGLDHNCGVTTEGAAYCWGHSGDGELGDGTNTQSNVPVAVSGGLTFQSVSAGLNHSCGVTTAGNAYCWGDNTFAQLGNGTNTDSYVPVAVSGGLTFQAVTAGFWHSCGVTTAGDAYCWGGNRFGQLGNGTTTDSNVPVAVSGGLTFQSVTVGIHSYSCGVTTTGDAYCWGDNVLGQLGSGTNTGSNVPVAVSGGLRFQSLIAGLDHSCGVTAAGDAYCWGENVVGSLGNGSLTASLVPVAVSGGLTFQAVTASFAHSCGVTTAGDAYCWGDNTFAELGDGTNTDSNVPVAVSGGLIFQSVTAGLDHSCGVTTAGDAYCWGGNSSGQLGDGTTTASNVPVRVGGL